MKNASKPRFIPIWCGSKAEISQDGKVVTKVTGVQNYSEDYDCAVLGTPCYRFKVKLLQKCNSLMIGMASDAMLFQKDGESWVNNGVYLACDTGSLYGENGISNQLYLEEPCNADGTTIEVVYENEKVYFIVDGVNRGTAFEIGGEVTAMYPAFELYEEGCSVEFIE